MKSKKPKKRNTQEMCPITGFMLQSFKTGSYYDQQKKYRKNKKTTKEDNDKRSE